MTAPLSVVELNEAAIRAALVALREGRSTGNATLDHVVDALGRCQARAWANFRSAWPGVSAAEIDVAADMTLDVVASIPALVVMLVITDAVVCDTEGGAS